MDHRCGADAKATKMHAEMSRGGGEGGVRVLLRIGVAAAAARALGSPGRARLRSSRLLSAEPRSAITPGPDLVFKPNLPPPLSSFARLLA